MSETPATSIASHIKLYEEMFNEWISNLIQILDNIMTNTKDFSIKAHPPDGVISISVFLTSGKMINIILGPILKDFIKSIGLRDIKEPSIGELLSSLKERGLIGEFNYKADDNAIVLNFTTSKILNTTARAKNVVAKTLSNPVYLVILSSIAIAYNKYAIITDCSLRDRKHFMKIRLL